MFDRNAHFLRLAACVTLVLSAGFSGLAADRQKPAATAAAAPQGELTKLSDCVYAQVVSPDSDFVSNSGIIVLDSGVLIFDTHFTPEAGASLLDKVKTVTPHPVRYVVNSHFHPDHTHGNQAFLSARQIIGSTNTRRDMLQKDLADMNQTQTIAQSRIEQLSKGMAAEPDARQQELLRSQLNSLLAFTRRMSALKIVTPVMTFDDALSILDAGREVDLLYLGIAHTEGDLVLYMPQEKIAFMGDVFFNAAIPNVADGSVLEWMKTLREALKLDAKTFVPGHGPVGTRRDVEEFLGYFEDLKAIVEPAVARGDSFEQVVNDVKVPSKYVSYNFQNFFPSNLQKMYAELKAAQPASPPPEGTKKKDCTNERFRLRTR